jgi:UDP-N-acetylglucosamine--N-acetylmuramyl-(pentapeptide) pyrophosphoryl-undecaprenol N-acetylglucosamine transferase
LPSLETNNAARIIISGGGTGGHIFPALSIAHAIRKIQPDAEILFVGAEGKMEMEKVPAAGYKIVGLPIAGIRRELSLANLKFPLLLLRSLSRAREVIRDFKPDVAVGVGGYASGPLLLMASMQGIPYLIQEQNSFPGITNKFLAKKAKKICVAYENLDRFFPADKILFTGNPVREDLKEVKSKKAEAETFFGLDSSRPVLLVTGGSQGARSINKAVLAGLNDLRANGIQLIWQTGKFFAAEAQSAVAALNDPSIKAYEFLSRMDLAYAICNVVVGRAGASTVSELCIVQKPSILVPLPTAAEDHQTKNCEALVQRNAGLLVKDADAAQQLIKEAISLIKDTDRCDQLAHNIAPLGRPNAAAEIAQQVLSLIPAKR